MQLAAGCWCDDKLCRGLSNTKLRAAAASAAAVRRKNKGHLDVDWEKQAVERWMGMGMGECMREKRSDGGSQTTREGDVQRVQCMQWVGGRAWLKRDWTGTGYGGAGGGGKDA